MLHQEFSRYSSTPAETDVNGSICPKGWRLPANYSIDTTRSWGALTTAYGITTSGANTNTSTGYTILESLPLLLQRSGFYYNGAFYRGGILGSGWSSTAQSTTYAYTLSLSNSYVEPQTYSLNSAVGLIIRCLAVR